MERAAILSRSGTVAADDLPPHIAARLEVGPRPSLPPQMSLAETEKAHIIQTLERFGWKHSRAADALGIGRTTLWRKLKSTGSRLPERRRAALGDRRRTPRITHEQIFPSFTVNRAVRR